MRKTTNGGTNQDIHHKIVAIKEKMGWSWHKLGEKAYYRLPENDDDNENYKNQAEEEEAIKKFTEKLKKNIERRLQGKESQKNSLAFLENVCRCLCELKEVRDTMQICVVPTDLVTQLAEFNEYIAKGFYPKSLWAQIREDYKKGLFQNIKALVQEENAVAQTALGHFYFYSGKEGIQNFAKAREYYTLAAEQNDKVALYQLGLIYEYGYGDIGENKHLAFKYYEQSAKQNYPLALNKLAFCYYYGEGTEQSDNQFFIFAEKSAAQNDAVGLLYLAKAHEKGEGTPINIAKAIEIYEEQLSQIQHQLWLFPIYSRLATLYYKYPQTQNIEKAQKYLDLAKQNWQEHIDNMGLDIIQLFESLIPLTPKSVNKVLHYEQNEKLFNQMDYPINKMMFLIKENWQWRQENHADLG